MFIHTNRNSSFFAYNPSPPPLDNFNLIINRPTRSGTNLYLSLVLLSQLQHQPWPSVGVGILLFHRALRCKKKKKISTRRIRSGVGDFLVSKFFWQDVKFDRDEIYRRFHNPLSPDHRTSFKFRHPYQNLSLLIFSICQDFCDLRSHNRGARFSGNVCDVTIDRSCDLLITSSTVVVGILTVVTALTSTEKFPKGLSSEIRRLETTGSVCGKRGINTVVVPPSGFLRCFCTPLNP